MLRLARAAGVVFEVLYDPWPTPLAAAAHAAGLPLVGGLDLLVHQAAVQVELMTGVGEAPLAAMRAAGEARPRGRSGVTWGDGRRGDRSGRLGSPTMTWYLDTAAAMAAAVLRHRASGCRR